MALAHGQLIADVSAEQFVSPRSGQHHLVSALDLSEQIVEREYDRTDRELVEVVQDVLESRYEVEGFLRIHDEQAGICPLCDLLGVSGLIAFGVGKNCSGTRSLVWPDG